MRPRLWFLLIVIKKFIGANLVAIPWFFPSNKFTGKNNYMIYIHYYRHDELIKERFLFATAKNTMSLFFFMNIPKEKPFRQLDKQLVLCLQCTIVIHINYIQPCFIYDPDSSPSLSYIWSWFFPISTLFTRRKKL